MSCSEQKKPTEFKRLKIWEAIQVAAKEERINYLLEISQDTLYCQCNEDRIPKEDFFSKHFDKMKQPYNREYDVYEERFKNVKGYNKRYRISYFDGGRGDETSSTIYTILVGEKGIKFLGVFSIP